ncbi:hypothetical protein OG257_00400 [Streptomyces sp. NBC_00683]|uniref:hypothetical protein n=1 Tax=Streptomyces sp. NBC_00683 TaxID=2903670 RepID=UPI002E36D80D|nr:hypothetical protein [Streptomyces sp. NBC_00683]
MTQSTTRKRPRSIRFLLILALAVAGLGINAPSAVAAECDPVLGVICGKVYNYSGTTLVAAALDANGGGSCAPYGRCRTCDVPPGSNSVSACGWLFKDADVMTFQYDSYYYAGDGRRHSANDYIKFDSATTIDCYGTAPNNLHCEQR